MRIKRKKCDKIDFHLPNYVYQSYEKNYIGIRYLTNILHACEGIEQVNLFKKIESYLLQEDITEDESQIVTDALCVMFYQSPHKSSHKKALNRTIQEISQKYPLAVEKYLQKSLETITNLSASSMSIEEIEASVLHIVYLIDNLKLGKKVVNQNFVNVWKFSSLILKTVNGYLIQEINLQKKNDYYDVCQNILKLVTQLIQNCDHLKTVLKTNNDEKFQVFSEEMRTCFEYLLTHEETKLNCRFNAAFAFCHYYYFSFGSKKLKDDMLSEGFTQFSLSSQLCIFSSIMAILPTEDFIENSDKHITADKLLLSIIEISKRSSSSEVLLLCARNILQWTNIIQNAFSNESSVDKNQLSKISSMFVEDKTCMKMLFEYVVLNRDHFIDTIRHLSRDIFRNILNIHILSSEVEPKESTLLKEMTIYLLRDLPPHNRGKYGMLSCIVEKIGTETILEWHPMLPIELYQALEECSLVTHVSELFQRLFSSSLDSEDDRTFQINWLVPLLKVLCKGSKEQTSAISEHVLPKLLSVKQSTLSFLLSELSDMWENNVDNSFSALIICVKLYQRQKGSLNYLEFMPYNSLVKAFFHADDQVRLSAFALLCESYKTTEPIDSNCFELIKCGLPYNINCQSPPFRQQLISYMKKLLTRIYESGYTLMKKQMSADKEKTILSKAMLPGLYQEFLHWLKEYLFSCLHPGANFPRRSTALNLLHIIHEIFQHSFPIVDSEVALQTLIHTLQDTYEHNKSFALKILCSKISVKLNMEDETLFQSALMLASSTKPPDTATAASLFTYMVHCPCYQHLIQRHLLLLQSQKYHLSLIVPDASELSYDLHFSTIVLLIHEMKKQFDIAKKNLLEAAACAPLYGILTCIRSLLNDVKFVNDICVTHWQQLFKELIQLSLNVVHVVEPVVCNSSPEGHLPVDMDDDSIAQLQAAVRRALNSRFQSAVIQGNTSSEFDGIVLDVVKTHAVTAQILLLCCWRTHKEISLLFGDIFEKVPLINPTSHSSYGILNESQVKDIGQYFLHQMSLVKHKGAFEQAQIGFCKICNKLWRCDIPKLREFPKLWLEDMILSMKGLKEDIQLCPTRRSAGLPFIIQAILASEPCFSNSSFFQKSMSVFLNLAQLTGTQNSDVQVHALNVLRTLFRDSCLGEAVMPFVSQGLQIAIRGFKSLYWAVRNSSTMLFSSLMTRVFGVNRSHDEAGKKNRLTGKCFYSYYKDLYFFLIDELKQCVSSLNLVKENKNTKIFIQPSLYPILLLLGRLYPAPGEEDTILSVFIPYLKICTGSPVWKIRTLAARAVVSFTPNEKVIFNVESLLETFKKIRAFSQNEIHGELLQVAYFMEEIGYMSYIQKHILTHDLEFAFFKSLPLYVRLNKCASTKAAFLQIYLYAMVLDIESVDIFLTGDLFQALINDFDETYTDPDKDNYLAMAASIIFLKCCHLSRMDLIKVVYGTGIGICPKEIPHFLLFNSHKAVSVTVIEIFLWLLQDDYESSYSSDSYDDVVVQRVLKTVTLMDKSKFNVEKLKEEPLFCRCLVESFHYVKDQSLLKQYCKLMCFVPSTLTRYWQFVTISSACDLINKLKYILNKMKNHYKDNLTAELFLYATQICVKLGMDNEACKKDMSIFVEKDFDTVEKWLEKVVEYAYPDNSILLRQTVVSVLGILTEKKLFPKSKLLGSHSSYLWKALMLVLVDDEPEIKQRASDVVMKMKLAQNQGNNILSAVPTKAVDIMVEMFIDSNYEDLGYCVSILINWMMSSDVISLDFMNDEQPFDKGELNVYSEDLYLTDIISKHLSSYLTAQKLSNENLSQVALFWKDQQDKKLTFSEGITLCLSEANLSIKSFLNRAAISPMLDTYFDQELIQISQRVSVALSLLPFSEILPNFKVLGNELLEKLQGLNFRTFFIENIISDIQVFLNML